MVAQVVLTPTESKKFISKAVAQMDMVQKALADGTIVIHPSTSTCSIIEELLGKPSDAEVWICGLIVPQRLCRSKGKKEHTPTLDHFKDLKKMMDNFPFKLVIKNRELITGMKLGQILEDIGPNAGYARNPELLI